MTMPFDATAGTDEEAALLARLACGDGSAAALLTLRHLPRVLRLASRLLDDPAEAEDVAQEAMLRLWRIAPHWRTGEAQVSTWLYRVAVNLCADRRRARARLAPLDSAADAADGAPQALTAMMAADRAAALLAALARLPDRQRQAVVLRHLEGLSNPEIAAVMDTSVEAVESLTARGKRALAALLAGQREELGHDDRA